MAVNPKNLEVLAYGSVDLDPNQIQQSLNGDGEYLSQALQDLLKQKLNGHLPSNQVAISVPTSRTYSRTMTMPAATEDLVEAVNLEAEQYIPIPVSELYVDYQIISEDKKERTVLISAVPRKIVDTLVECCEKANLDVVMVEPGLNATARIIQATEEGHLPSVIVDVGAATSDVGLVEGGIVRLTGSVPVGGHSFTYKIAEKLKIPLEEAHQLKVHSGLATGPNQSKIKIALDPLTQQIVLEIRKILRYYKERIGIKTKIEQIIVTGGGSNVPGLGEIFTDELKMPSRVADPWHSLSFGKLTPPNKNFKARYTTAAGLSIADLKGQNK